MKRLSRFFLALVACGLMVKSQAAEIVYDNLVNPLGLFVGGFGYEEVADDLTLAGSARIFESLTVAYAGFNFDGDETLTVSLYRMDGAPTPGSFGFNTPGSVLFSTTVPIVATSGAVLTFTSPGVGVLPETLAVGFAFSGVDFDPTGAGSDGGPLLYDPPSPGSSFDDFWLRGFPTAGAPWGLFTFGGNPPINLGIRIRASVVPEAGTMFEFCGLAALLGTSLWGRFRKAT